MAASLRALLLALVPLVAAIPTSDVHAFGAMAIKESIAEPRSWVQVGAAAPETRLTAQIALKQNNIDGLLAHLDDVSNPHSPNYGKWLSKEEMEVFTAPAESTVNTVKAWLTSNGIAEDAISHPAPDWLTVSLRLSEMESLLQTQYAMYEHPGSTHAIPRALSYSLPASLHDLVDTIQPTTAFYRALSPQVAHTGNHTADPRPLAKRAQCDPNNINPDCIKAYYNVDWSPSNRANVGVTGFLNFNASHNDAKQFFSRFAPNVPDFYDINAYGGQNSGASTLEGNLDTQYGAALAYPNDAYFVAMGPANDDFNDQMSNLAIYLSSQYSPPTSVSTSYGGEEFAFDGNYLDRICNEFAKAGSMGVTMLFSSGDNGVGGNGETSCPSFYPLWPASCPYSLAVGATQITSSSAFSTGPGQPTEEAAWFGDNGGTGGGFSGHFGRPSYQDNDVPGYINSLNGEYSGMYNANGRGIPDVALVGELYDVMVDGQIVQVLGTSASAPSWAALISVLNDYRISQGRPTLGFINPLLYSSARGGLRDVQGQGSRGCGTNGFPATQGWDAATGLGSLDFATLRSLV